MHDTYTWLRHLADSWGLLALVAVFVGAVVWALRPGSRALHDDAARSIFRDAPPPVLARSCDRNCATCACAGKEGF